MCDDSAWDEEALAAIEGTIRIYRDALRALVGGAQSYSLDTGQTRQTVTKANLTEIRRALGSFESERKVILVRLGRGGSVVVTPEF